MLLYMLYERFNGVSSLLHYTSLALRGFDSVVVTAGCVCVKEHVCVCTWLWEVS